MFHNINLRICEILLSLPSRERGLKFWHRQARWENTGSLPSRERGLKSSVINMSYYLEVVAPFAGAWIEIAISSAFSTSAKSLPSRERGLKYQKAPETHRRSLSLPSRERGLKYCFDALRCTASGRSLRGSVDWNNVVRKIWSHGKVAPFAGAWIEIMSLWFQAPQSASLPSRERGLKWWRIILNSGFLWSLPSWECGLKSVERK